MTQVVRPLLADAKLSLLAVVNPLTDVQNQPVAVKRPLVDATTVAGVLTSQLAGVKHPLVVAE